MPELPDVFVYLEAFSRMLLNKTVNKAIIKSPFLLRTFDPPLEAVQGQVLTDFSRIGKRIVWHCDNGMRLVFHLMIAGRFHWKPNQSRLPKSKTDLAAFQFDHGTMMLTEASCPRCQTGGKRLADRSLSRLLKGDWPKTIEELEG